MGQQTRKKSLCAFRTFRSMYQFAIARIYFVWIYRIFLCDFLSSRLPSLKPTTTNQPTDKQTNNRQNFEREKKTNKQEQEQQQHLHSRYFGSIEEELLTLSGVKSYLLPQLLAWPHEESERLGARARCSRSPARESVRLSKSIRLCILGAVAAAARSTNEIEFINLADCGFQN